MSEIRDNILVDGGGGIVITSTDLHGVTIKGCTLRGADGTITPIPDAPPHD